MNQPKMKIGDHIRICFDGWCSKKDSRLVPAVLMDRVFRVAKVEGDRIAFYDGRSLHWPRSWVRCRG